ncbi:MAG TPA: response regulator transcription factor [Ktedonobacterales bacterium]|nr:response regulator transcription factor [Ktedonobacterales bacterium]
MTEAGTDEVGDATPRRRVLVVDDEASIREVLAQYLRLEGFHVLLAADGVEALRLAESRPPDLIVLDLMLPGMDGYEVCRRLRAASAVPILMLTARSEELDKLSGFAVGADDYVTKPFSPREVVMRVQAIMRRLDATSVPAMVLDDTLRVGNLVITPGLRTVERDGAPVEVTAKEFDLLHFLAAHPKQVFTRQQLLDHVWDIGYYGDASTVTVHIRRLREKVEQDPALPRHLKTVWGIGYKFEP